MTSSKWAAMSKLVAQLYAHHEAEPFRRPVDWKSHNLHDYPHVIKKPMDLSRVKRNIEKRQYETLNDAADDIRLIWKNCILYNKNSQNSYGYVILAKKFADRFDMEYAELTGTKRRRTITSTKTRTVTALSSDDDDDDDNDDDDDENYENNDEDNDSSSVDDDEEKNETTTNKKEKKIPEPSIIDKRQFATQIPRLSKEELGKVMLELERRCPVAIEKNQADDEVEIDVDMIPAKVFPDILDFVAKCNARCGGGQRK